MADLLSMVALGAGGLGAAVALVQGGRAFGTARVLAATGPSPMGELFESLVEVRGTTGPNPGVVSPWSGRPALYARFLVEQQRRTRWEAVIDRKETAPFRLDDGTGQVTVDPQQAEVVVAAAARVRTGVFAVPSEEWSQAVARLGPTLNEPQVPFLRWREEVIEPGAALSVVGRARPTPSGWEVGPDPEGFVVSDREEGDVVRHHRRLGWRWLGVLVVALAVAGWGVAGFLPSAAQ